MTGAFYVSIFYFYYVIQICIALQKTMIDISSLPAPCMNLSNFASIFNMYYRKNSFYAPLGLA